MKIQSSAFQNNGYIPVKYTCDGENINPPLEILDAPEKAKSLVLVMDDPDAPMGTWVHWILWNINPQIQEISENSVPTGAIQGKTNRENCYSGPRPPSGTHRYFFKLFALDNTLDLSKEIEATTLMQRIQNNIIDQAELIGLYKRN